MRLLPCSRNRSKTGNTVTHYRVYAVPRMVKDRASAAPAMVI